MSSNNYRKWLLLGMATLVVAGCSTREPIRYQESVLAKETNEFQNEVPEPREPVSEDEQRLERLDSIQNSGIYTNSESDSYVPKFDDEKVTVSAEQMAVDDFVHLVFGEILSLDYALDDSVRSGGGTITLNLNERVSKTELFKIARELLRKENVQFEHEDGLLYFVALQQGQSDRFSLGVGSGANDVPSSAGQIVQIIPLKYVEWISLRRVLNFLSDTKVEFMSDRNSMLVKGARKEVMQVIRVVDAFDRPSARGRHIGIFELTFIGPEEFRKQLSKILQAEGISLGKGQEGALIITPLERTRGVLVHSASAELFNRVEYWAEQLDVPTSTDDREYYTYFPKNVRAAELGQSLSQLFQLSYEGKAVGGRAGSSRSSEQEDATSSQGNDRTQQSAASQSGIGFRSEDLSMSVDDFQNALIFYATPSKYHEVLGLVERMDVLPGQILIEAAITEVTLEGSFRQGIDWTLRREGSFGAEANAITEFSDGLNYSLTGLDYQVALNFLQTNSTVNILSRPRILVKDGRSATLNVGTEVPVITQQAGDLDADSERFIQNIDYRNTGVTLDVTPSINSRGVISLQINQTVSEAGENSLSGVNSPIILNRSFSTEMLAQDGKTVVLGGLISENRSDGGTKVPLLGDLPLIGNLFKTRNESTNRVELLVMITPRIIRSDKDIDEVVDAIFGEFQSLEREQ